MFIVVNESVELWLIRFIATWNDFIPSMVIIRSELISDVKKNSSPLLNALKWYERFRDMHTQFMLPLVNRNQLSKGIHLKRTVVDWAFGLFVFVPFSVINYYAFCFTIKKSCRMKRASHCAKAALYSLSLSTLFDFS